MLSRFHLVPERNGQTDGQTDLLYQYRASICWRAIMTHIIYTCVHNYCMTVKSDKEVSDYTHYIAPAIRIWKSTKSALFLPVIRVRKGISFTLWFTRHTAAVCWVLSFLMHFSCLFLRPERAAQPTGVRFCMMVDLCSGCTCTCLSPFGGDVFRALQMWDRHHKGQGVGIWDSKKPFDREYLKIAALHVNDLT